MEKNRTRRQNEEVPEEKEKGNFALNGYKMIKIRIMFSLMRHLKFENEKWIKQKYNNNDNKAQLHCIQVAPFRDSEDIYTYP